jgi:hypothetical protein
LKGQILAVAIPMLLCATVIRPIQLGKKCVTAYIALDYINGATMLLGMC